MIFTEEEQTSASVDDGVSQPAKGRPELKIIK
jgi:hypothetical protein